MIDYIVVYLLIINLIGFIVCFYDKNASKSKGKMRIPESTLFTIAIVGGGAGFWIGMHFFRHKTKHWYFVVGIPIIVVIQSIIFLIILH